MAFSYWQMCLLATAIFLLAYLLVIRPTPAAEVSLESTTNFERVFQTARSNRTLYSDIERDLYTPLGFRTVKVVRPFPILDHSAPLSCKKVFDDWLAIATTYDANQTPPKEIPASAYPAFSMNGLAFITYWYFNEKSSSKPVVWSQREIEERLRAAKFKYHYGVEGEGVNQALKSHSIAGKTGMVIGTQIIWVEPLCLKHHAVKVITMEYQRILTDHPQLGYVHPIELAKNWTAHHEKYDFIISFSSIEHSGLGRYGDPLDPIGDIRELQKVQCLLKKGGLMFLGVPTGADGIAFNAHRYYGRIRLPMMFAGYNFLGSFDGAHTGPVTITEEYLNERNGYQYVFVLQKI